MSLGSKARQIKDNHHTFLSVNLLVLITLLVITMIKFTRFLGVKRIWVDLYLCCLNSLKVSGGAY